jgi:nucleotide-binding universal stress UspA family protein
MSGFELGTDGPRVMVVGVDGSRTSLRAAAYAAGMARRQSARLVVVYVSSVPPSAALAPMSFGPMEEALGSTAAELRRQVVDGAAQLGISAEFVTVKGDPLHELVRVAEEVRADAVVVGASAHAGHRVVGSIAVRLVRSERWPVIVVP